MNNPDQVPPHKWPQFPALKIHEWLSLQLSTTLYYHFIKLGKVKAIFIMKTKNQGLPIKFIKEHLWPEWPILDIQDFFSLDIDSSLGYELFGTSKNNYYVGINLSINQMGPVEREYIEKILGNDSS